LIPAGLNSIYAGITTTILAATAPQTGAWLGLGSTT